jgi:hypothetical protein
MTYETETTADRFVLSVHSSAPRCSPIAATAVAYAMPANGMAWPQQLIEARPIQIAAGGTVEIAFERTCSPTQFDVVTGATPERIAPWADWHGPLLFPLDPATAFQDPGRDCDAPTTTTAPTTPAPTSVAPSTAVPPTTVPPTTVTGPGGPGDSVPGDVARNPDPPGGPVVEVLAVTTVPAAGAVDVTPVDPTRGERSLPRVGGLALTGATTGILVAAAVLLIVFGVGFVVGSWLRTRGGVRR